MKIIIILFALILCSLLGFGQVTDSSFTTQDEPIDYERGLFGRLKGPDGKFKILTIKERRKTFAEVYQVYAMQLPISRVGNELHWGGSNSSPTQSGPGYVLTGQITIDIPIIKPFVNPAKYKPNVGILFMPEIRMLYAESKPIRTPSYHVGMYYRHYVGGYGIKNHYPFLEATLIHHSNGQFASPYIIQNGQQIINKIDGSFSTNYSDFSFGLLSKRTNNIFLLQKYGVEIQHNFPANFDDGVAENYGLVRFEAQAALIFNANVEIKHTNQVFATYEWLRLSANVSVNAGRMDYVATNSISERINAEVTARWRIRAFQLSLFSTLGWTGQDQYNIYYQDSYYFIRAGTSLNINSPYVFRDALYASVYPFKP